MQRWMEFISIYYELNWKKIKLFSKTFRAKTAKVMLLLWLKDINREVSAQMRKVEKGVKGFSLKLLRQIFITGQTLRAIEWVLNKNCVISFRVF